MAIATDEMVLRHALKTPRWQRLRTEIAENVRLGAPLEDYMLEAEECVKWLSEESEQSIGDDILDAIATSYTRDEKTRQRFDALVTKLMLGTMTADELCEYRDIHRAALIDSCSSWARKAVAKDLGV